MYRIIEEHRKALLAAGDDPIRIIAANKAFFARKHSYLNIGRPLNESYLFNRNTRGSYHLWSASVMGEAFGDSGLKELISIKDYLDSPPIIDEFLSGVIVGMKRAAERKARQFKEQQRKNQHGVMPSETDKLMKGKY